MADVNEGQTIIVKGIPHFDDELEHYYAAHLPHTPLRVTPVLLPFVEPPYSSVLGIGRDVAEMNLTWYPPEALAPETKAIVGFVHASIDCPLRRVGDDQYTYNGMEYVAYSRAMNTVLQAHPQSNVPILRSALLSPEHTIVVEHFLWYDSGVVILVNNDLVRYHVHNPPPTTPHPHPPSFDEALSRIPVFRLALPTVGMRVTYTDGRVENVIVSRVPLVRICEYDPHGPPLAQSNGPTPGWFTHMKATRVFVPDRARIALAAGHATPNPPYDRRGVELRFKNPPPRPGACIGYVRYQPLHYCGVGHPSMANPDIEMHLFEWMGAMFVTLRSAGLLLHTGGDYTTSLTTYTETTTLKMLAAYEESFTITDTPTYHFWTLHLIKLLGAVHRKSPRVTLVRTDRIDALVAPEFRPYAFTWDCNTTT